MEKQKIQSITMWAKATLVVFITAFLSVCGASVVLGEAKEVEALRTFTELLRSKIGKDATNAVEVLKGETFSQVVKYRYCTTLFIVK